VPDDELEAHLAELDLGVIPFDLSHALAAGALRRETRAAGPSLGDRCCLALAWRNSGYHRSDLGSLSLSVGIEVVRRDCGLGVRRAG
jgi:hypothetical protein